VILYSIVPAEIVFDNNTNNIGNRFVEIDYMGQKVEAVSLSNSQFVISRVLSTSPQVYLNPKLQPGTIIRSS